MENKSNNFESTSYDAHASWYAQLYPNDEDKRKRVEMWKQTDTVNTWLHRRLYSLTDQFAQPQTSWLTVGDGNGADANYLLQRGCKVMASDISGEILQVAKNEGFIKEFSVENAEKLSFADNSFDYVLCKESYHHFPRPAMGLYEMLRVARKGVILIEPQDPLSKMPLMLAMCNIFDRIDSNLMRKFWKNRYSFEEVGNFVFKISERELEKEAMAIQMPAIAFKGCNDLYIKGVETEKASPNSKLFGKVKRKLALKNLLTGLHLMPTAVLCAVIFKEKPIADVLKELKIKHFRYVEFPKNPYLK